MARTTIRTEDITAGEVTTAKMATDPTNASNLSSGSVPTAQLGNVNTSGLEDDIALLGFKVASNGSLAKYNLVDQTVDDFQDATGVNASSSTNEVRDTTGKYYQGQVDNSLTGGTETTYVDSGTTYVVNTFLTSDDLVVSQTTSIDAIMVGGGGEGGGTSMVGGGGGGGAVLHRTGYSLTAATYAIVIGQGGENTASTDGGDTTGFSVTATGGGGGNFGETAAGRPGANGGGGGYGAAAGSGTAPTASGWTVYAGNNGGVGGPGSGSYGGGGGGGAGVAGAAGVSTGTGFGGNGKQITIANNSYYWGAGGGGSVYTTGTSGSGGLGGGGGGSNYFNGGNGSGGGSALNSGYPGTDHGSGVDKGPGGAAGANTGSGGGGFDAAGGDGIVIVVSVQGLAAENLTLVSTTTAAQAAPTKGDIVFTYTNGAGSTTLGTDVTAEISADGGSTWTAMTLGSEGSTGSHNIATAHDVTITSTITSPWNMAYRIKTLNQAVGKTTRIQAVSLGWS